MSFGRAEQLKELQDIIQEISREIMWVNDREEEELVFDWGDKNIDQYIPRKQESYSVSVCQISVATNTFRKSASRGPKVVLRSRVFVGSEHNIRSWIHHCEKRPARKQISK